MTAIAPPTPAGSGLREELGEIDKARQALARGDAQGALSDLDAHDRRFGKGALGPEAMLTRIEALLATGRVADAHALSRTLLSQPGGQAYAARVGTLLQKK